MGIRETTCWGKLLLLAFLTLYPKSNCLITGSSQLEKADSPKWKYNHFNFHPDYWTKLQEAIKYAKCVENEVLPSLDDLSLIMKPASCRKEPLHQTQHCKECTENPILPKLSNDLEFYQGAEPPKPTFHCTSHVNSQFKTHFRMEYPTYHLPTNLSKEEIPRIFVVEKEVNGKWMAVKDQIFWFFPLETKKGSTYRIRVTAVSSKYIYYPLESEPIKIYDPQTQTIGKPKNFRVVETKIDVTAARHTPTVTLRWESGSGKNASCDFDLFYMDEEDFKLERNKPEEAFWVILDKVQFDKTYKIHLMERFGYRRESEISIITTTIPSCLQLQNFSFDACPPPTPSNIRIENETSNSFWITWDRFKEQHEANQILAYDISVRRLPNEGLYKLPELLFSGSVPGNQTHVYVDNITTKGTIEVSVLAISKAGKSHDPGIFVYQLRGDPFWAKNLEKFWAVIVILILLLMLVGGIFYLKNFRDKLQRNKEKKEKWKKLDEDVPTVHIDRYSSKWEIAYEDLTLHNVVGRGNFADVRKATLNRRGTKTTVAVKTLRVHPETPAEDLEADNKALEKDIIDRVFREEFKILKEIDPHKHVVGLVGVVRQPSPALVVEYCDGGDLESHLRKSAPTKIKRSACPSLISNGGEMLGSTVQLQSNCQVRVQLSMVTNEAYFMRNEIESHLSPMDLLSYARQIASGMEFLSSNKIIHRDLATRNVLISGKDRILKIADFGLSRDVYEHNRYNSSNGKIPVKWLAIESLEFGCWNLKSDVWSFGIVLWEIVTFGAIPYSNMDNIKLLYVLKKGYRMPKPDNCSNELYGLMTQCWHENPDQRPNFLTIRKTIEDLMHNSDEVKYINLETTGTEVQYTQILNPPET